MLICLIFLSLQKHLLSILALQISPSFENFLVIFKIAMYMKWLKRSFCSLSLLCLALMTWYAVLPPPRVIDQINQMYFYEYEPLYKQNFRFTLRERLKCEDNNTFLVILVASKPTDVKARQAIRLTWGSKKSWWGNRVLTLFLLGQGEGDTFSLSVEDESILYGDIIRQDFLDKYNNLTLKTIMAFRWVTEFCPNARYVMKTDSDVFINTGNLVKFLLNSNTSENFVTGYVFMNNYSDRWFLSKFYISYSDYPFKTYPPYCSGFGYILDTRLACRIYETMSHIKPIKFEDIYVGICLYVLGVGISVPEDAELFFLKRINFSISKYRHIIAVHGISSYEMMVFWQKITKDTSPPDH